MPQSFEVKSSNLVLPNGGRWSSRAIQAWSGFGCQFADLLLLAGTYLGILALPYFNSQGNLAELLQMRVLLRYLLVALMCLGTWHVLLVVIGVYSIRLARSIPEYVFRCVIALNCCAAVVGLIEVVLRKQSSVWHNVALFWLVSSILFVLLRVLRFAFVSPIKTSLLPVRRLIIVGNGQRAAQLYDEVRSHPEWAYSVVGFVGFELEEPLLPAALHLGGVKELEKILADKQADEVIIAIPMKSHNEIVGHAIAVCQMVGVSCHYFTEHFGTSMDRKVLAGI